MFGPIPGSVLSGDAPGAATRPAVGATRRCASRRWPPRRRSSPAERLQARQQQGLLFRGGLARASTAAWAASMRAARLGCRTCSKLRWPGAWARATRAGGTIFAAVVPDAVGSVTLEFDAGGRDPARSITSRAVNNVVVFKIPPHTAHQQSPTATVGSTATRYPRPRLLLKRRAMHTQMADEADHTSAGSRPDRRLASLLAVFRWPLDAADRSPGALKGAAATHTDRADRPIRWPRSARREDLPLSGQRPRDPASTQRQGGEHPFRWRPAGRKQKARLCGPF